MSDLYSVILILVVVIGACVMVGLTLAHGRKIASRDKTDLMEVVRGLMSERSSLLDRIQSPDVQGLYHRKQMEARFADDGDAADEDEPENYLLPRASGRFRNSDPVDAFFRSEPWRKDPAMQNKQVVLDKPAGLVWIHDPDEFEAMPVPLGNFMSVYDTANEYERVTGGVPTSDIQPEADEEESDGTGHDKDMAPI
jgi:hypothetical protein